MVSFLLPSNLTVLVLVSVWFTVHVVVCIPISGDTSRQRFNMVSSGVKCPVENPVSVLCEAGIGRRHLQRFTPENLFRTNESPDASFSQPSTSNLEQSSLSGAFPLQGCSQRVLASLTNHNLPVSKQTGCEYKMACSFDPQRYPSVLYEAVRSQPHHDGCPPDSQCLPVVRTVLLLRKREVNSCTRWGVVREDVIRKYRCQKTISFRKNET